MGTADGRLCFLDYGNMSETPQPARSAIIAHVVHLVNRDYAAMAQDYYKLGFLDRSVDTRPIVPALASFFDDVLTASVSELNFKRLVDGLGSLLYAYPFSVPGYYALILRSLTVLEGLALSSDPSFKVIAAAYPFFAQRLIADRSPALREALSELLFSAGRVRWARLESLLEQQRRAGGAGGLTSDSALPALLELVLGEEGSVAAPDASQLRLRLLCEAEAARCCEAVLLAGAGSGRDALLAALPAELRLRAATVLAVAQPAEAEMAELRELRERLVRVWALLAPAGGGGAAAEDAVALLRQPKVLAFASAVASRLAQRAMARTVQAAFSLGAPAEEAQPEAALAR